MSIFSAITKRSKLNALIKQSAEARKNEEVKAKQLFKDAYSGFAEVVMDDPLRAEALYNWGLALLHHAKLQTGDEAIKLYQDSFNKFSFCLLLDPNYLAAAIDSGVACMDLARIQGVSYHHELYENARKQFDKANAIQAGAASYNLACIYGLRGSHEACLKALEISRDKGLLPDANEILADPDLSSVLEQGWFVAFITTLKKTPEPAVENAETPAEKTSEAEQTQVQEKTADEVEQVPEASVVEETAEEQSTAEASMSSVEEPVEAPASKDPEPLTQEQGAEIQTDADTAEESHGTTEFNEGQEEDEPSATVRRRDYFLKL